MARTLVSRLLLAVCSFTCAAAPADDTDAIRSANQRLTAAVSEKSDRRASRSDVRAIAVERAERLRRLVATHPADVLKLALPPATVEAVAGIAGADAVERWGTWAGVVSVSIADDFENRRATTHFTGDGIDAWQEGTGSARCGDRVAFSGVQIGGRIAVRQSKVVERAAAGEGCSASGPQSTAVILVGWDGNPAPRATPAEVRDLMFGSTESSVKSWYAKESGGRASFEGEVFGPFSLPGSFTCGSPDGELFAALTSQVRGEIEWTRYKRFVLLFNAPRNCGYGGISTLGCKTISTPSGSTRAAVSLVAWGRGTRSILLHELGHALGVGHARAMHFVGTTIAPTPENAVVIEYGSPYSVMGAADDGPFSAQHRLEFGWMTNGADAQTVTGPGEWTLTPAGGSGLRALRVQRSAGARRQWVWVEYPDPARLPADSRRGALVHWDNSGDVLSTNLLDMSPTDIDRLRFSDPETLFEDAVLPEGAVWRDPDSDLVLRVISASPDALRIAVRYEPGCATTSGSAVQAAGAGGVFDIAVGAPAGCTWSARSNSGWVAMARTQTGVRLTVDALPGIDRAGSISVDGRVIPVLQRGVPQPAQLVSATPPNGKAGAGLPVPLTVVVEDANGVADIAAVTVRLQSARSCFIRYSADRDTFEIGGSPDGPWVVPTRDNSYTAPGLPCLAAPIAFLPLTSTAGAMYVVFAPLSDTAEWTAEVQVTDGSGQTGPWLSTSVSIRPTPGCYAAPAIAAFPVAARGGSGLPIPIAASSVSCPWTAASRVPWIKVRTASGTGSTEVVLDIEQNSGEDARTGEVAMGNGTLTIHQAGSVVTLTPSHLPVSGGAGFTSVHMTGAVSELGAAIRPQAPWLSVVDEYKSGNEHSVLLAFEENPSSEPRRGTVLFGKAVLTVTQEGSDPAAPKIAPGGAVHGATFRPLLAPNAWVTIRGSNLAAGTRSWSGSDFRDGLMPQALDGVRVLINGKAAYVAFISPQQINVLAPDDRATGPVSVEVDNNGRRSLYDEALMQPVVPGLFTLSAGGRQHAAATDAAGAYVASAGIVPGLATRPARPGEVVSLFATGLGPAIAAGAPGTVPSGPSPLVRAPTVVIGGREAEVQWAGLIGPGLYQVNVRVPEGLVAGEHQILLTASGVLSQRGVLLGVE